MNAVSGNRVITEFVDTAHDVEQHKRNHALAVWRTFPDLMVTKRPVDWRDIITNRAVKVILRMGAAQPLQLAQNVIRNRAFVKPVTTFLANSAKGGGKLWLTVPCAQRYRLAIMRKDGACVLIQRPQAGGKIRRNTLGHGVSVFGIGNGRCQDLR
ncbi:MAG: Uncharacterised protein [SAR116 cluster bacterium]|nr:MAG: Uncharacterised protein [SAR116 cluster bacterium]